MFIVEALLKRPDIEVDVRNSQGCTALHHLLGAVPNVSFFLIPMIKAFLNHEKIDLNLTNKVGRSILDHAIRWLDDVALIEELRDFIFPKMSKAIHLSTFNYAIWTAENNGLKADVCSKVAKALLHKVAKEEKSGFLDQARTLAKRQNQVKVVKRLEKY